MDKDCTEFMSVIMQISEDAELTSAIIRLQDTFSKNNLDYLIMINERIVTMLKDKFKAITPSVLEDVAAHISGLYGYHAKLKLAIIKRFTPHFAKWFESTMSRNMVLAAMNREEKANELCDKIVENSFNRSGELTNVEVVEMSLTALQRVKEIYSKSPRVLERIVEKHYGSEGIDNIDDVLSKLDVNNKSYN